MGAGGGGVVSELVEWLKGKWEGGFTRFVIRCKRAEGLEKEEAEMRLWVEVGGGLEVRRLIWWRSL